MRRTIDLMDDTPIGGSRINGNIFFVNSDIDRAETLNPFSHIYMFDVGFPWNLHCLIADKFNRSIYATHLVSYKPPTDIIDSFGFHVQFMDHQFSTYMHGKKYYSIISYFLMCNNSMIIAFDIIILGSGESHMVYFYRRASMATQVAEVLRPITRMSLAVGKQVGAKVTVMIPSRAHEEDQSGEEVVCDPCFLEAIQIATGETAELRAHVLEIYENEWNRVTARKITK